MGFRLALAVLLAAAVGVPVAAAAETPTALRASILDAGRKQSSVHYRSVSRAQAITVSIDADAGVSAGIQRITFAKNGKVGHVTVVVSGRTAYVRGDAFTLRQYLGFKAASATRYGNVWISIPSSHKFYEPIAVAVTIASAVDELGPQGGPLTAVAPTTRNGTQVLGVRSRTVVQGAPQVDTLYARASGARLPVEEVVVQGANRFSVAFDRWNEPVHVDVPKKTVPIATVEKAGSGPTA